MRRASHLRLTGAAVAGLVALAGTPATPAAAAAGAQAWRVPAAATITVTGHGFGHGHGMSQYGAEGAARQGLGYRQIVDFYYPGTSWGTATGLVRVRLSADTTPDLVVRARPGLTLRDLGGAAVTTLPANGASRWRARVDAAGVTRVAYRTDTWHRWGALQGYAEFAAGGRPVTLVTPSGERAYRGRLRTAVTSAGSRVTVNVLALDSYLRGVVPLEIPASWRPDAVRAQAVAARTYAAYGRAHPQSGAYQLCDTTACQVYGGYSAEVAAATRAVTDTAGQVLTSGGGPAFTQFGSSSGGWTSAGSTAYLPAREDPYDGWGGNPVHTWTTRVDDRAVERAWPSIGDLAGITVSRRDGHGEWGGRVTRLTLTGSRGSVAVSGDDFRSRLGLRSTWITFTVAAKRAG